MSTKGTADYCLQMFQRLLCDRQNKFGFPYQDVELDQGVEIKRQIPVQHESCSTAEPLP